MTWKKVIAVDLGGSGGRIMLGNYDGSRLSLGQLHRFSNDPVMLNNTLYWDFLRLFFEIKQGILKSKSYGRISSLGIDTWGVDFGLIDRSGKMMGNPVHYRDRRTAGFLEKSFEMMDKNKFYQITGNQFMEINTAFQLMALKSEMPEVLEQAEQLLLMPDLLGYFLSGERTSECSISSTTQLFDMKAKTWAWDVMRKLEVPSKLFGTLVPGGTVKGTLRQGIQKEMDIVPMQVIAVAEHDTQSALAAVPAGEEDFIFLSCGTWSLLGTELKEPVINEKSERFNITNELGMEGRYSFLKNITGLWLVQESRRQWFREGKEYSFGQLEEMALRTDPLACFVDPDREEFVPSGNIPERIRRFCENTGQRVPKTEGEVVCCINQSLALSYRKAMEEISECTGKQYPVIYMVGGGVQSRMLCQMTANACGCRVAAGPAEATAYGNIMIQYIAAGEFENLKQARQALMDSVELTVYEPEQAGLWEEAYQFFCRNILGRRY